MRIGLVAVLVLGVAGQGLAGTKRKVQPVQDEADDTGWYAGAGIGMFRIDSKTPNVDGLGHPLSFKDDAFGGYVNGGYAFTPNIAAELRVGKSGDGAKSFTTDDLALGVTPALPFTLTFGVDTFVSAFFKATAPLSDSASIYGLLGYSHLRSTSKLSVLTIAISQTESENALSFGGGVDFKVTDRLKLGAEYVRYYDDTDSDGVHTVYDSVVGTAKYRF